ASVRLIGEGKEEKPRRTTRWLARRTPARDLWKLVRSRPRKVSRGAAKSPPKMYQELTLPSAFNHAARADGPPHRHCVCRAQGNKSGPRRSALVLHAYAPYAGARWRLSRLQRAT